MEENKKEQENKSNFKAVQNQATINKAYKSEHKSKMGFANGFLLPFVSGSWNLFWCAFYKKQIIRLNIK